MVSAEYLLNLSKKENRPPVIVLSGGQPDLVPEYQLWFLEARKTLEMDKSHFIWSDDNLSNDFFWTKLTDDQRNFMKNEKGYARVACLKGYDPESFSFNTGMPKQMFLQQIQRLARFYRAGFNQYGYITLTTPTCKNIDTKIPYLFDKIQTEISEDFLLRIVPLEIFQYNVNSSEFHKQASQNQYNVLDVWRKGDMIIFLNDGKKLPENVECRIEEEWEDFLVGKIKVKIKKKNEELSKYIAPKILIKNPEDAVLYSVSRRSPIRKNIDLWTSTNIGLKIEGWKTMSLILDGISKGKNLEEISETILLNFSNLDKNQIKRDTAAVYQTLKDLLIMNENEHKPQHLAILVQPFLDLILKGEKTIETRFTKVKCPPFQKVKEGDIILLKKSGGLVVGEITAGKVEYFSDLSPEKMEELKKYSSEICADYDPYFWEKRKDSRYISFIHIARVKKYETPYPFPKNDRRAWLILDTVEKSCQPSLFDSLTQKKGRE